MASPTETLVAIAREGETFYRRCSERHADPVLRDAYRRMAEARAAMARGLGDALAKRPADRGDPAETGLPLEEIDRLEERLLRAFLLAIERHDSIPVRSALKTYLPQMAACRHALQRGMASSAAQETANHDDEDAGEGT